jgi:tetratricopeptide (TPR) repeat protein
MEYLFMDNLEMAKESFIKCLEEDLEDQSALYNVVYCFEFLDQNKEAITYLNQYIEKNPYSEIAWHQVGRLHYGLKEYEEAIRLDYLTRLNERYEAWISTYNKGKMLVIDIDNNRFHDNPEDLGKIIAGVDAQLHGLFK